MLPYYISVLLQTQFGNDLHKLIAAQLAFQKYHCNSVNSAAYMPNVRRKTVWSELQDTMVT